MGVLGSHFIHEETLVSGDGASLHPRHCSLKNSYSADRASAGCPGGEGQPDSVGRIVAGQESGPGTWLEQQVNGCPASSHSIILTCGGGGQQE